MLVIPNPSEENILRGRLNYNFFIGAILPHANIGLITKNNTRFPWGITNINHLQTNASAQRSCITTAFSDTINQAMEYKYELHAFEKFHEFLSWAAKRSGAPL